MARTPRLTVTDCKPGDDWYHNSAWFAEEREKQDGFVEAMHKAIAAGTENCATTVSTSWNALPAVGYRDPTNNPAAASGGRRQAIAHLGHQTKGGAATRWRACAGRSATFLLPAPRYEAGRSRI
jgi:hypothetical protein